jgi:hypothetical protein
MTNRMVLLVGLALALTFGHHAPARADERSQTENAKARAEAARKVYQVMIERWQKQGEIAGVRRLELEDFYRWSRRWMEAERDAAADKAGWAAAVEKHLGRMREWEKTMREMHKVQLASPYEVVVAEFYALEAESWLAKEKAK